MKMFAKKFFSDFLQISSSLRLSKDYTLVGAKSLNHFSENREISHGFYKKFPPANEPSNETKGDSRKKA